MEVKSKGDTFASKLQQHFPVLLALRSRWIDLSSVGSAAASELVNTILRIKQLESGDHWGVLKDDSEVRLAVIYKLELQMQLKSESLEATFEDLVRLDACKQFSKAKVAMETLEGLYWAILSGEAAGNVTEPVLRTALPEQWIEWGKRLLSMFGQDLVLKRTLVTAMTRSAGEKRTQLLLYLNAWLASPLVDPLLVSSITDMANAELEEVSARSTGNNASNNASNSSRAGSASSTPTRDTSAASSAHTPSSSRSPASLQPTPGTKTPKSAKTSPSKKSSAASKSPSSSSKSKR